MTKKKPIARLKDNFTASDDLRPGGGLKVHREKSIEVPDVGAC